LKQLVVSFDDEEFEALKRAKGEKTWRGFLLDIANNGGSEKAV
jgi:hypothetical protein